MNAYTQPLARLIEEFQKLPGVGPKSAQRLAFHILKRSPHEVQSFSEALTHAKETIHECSLCYNLSNQSPCELCTNRNRNPRIIAVVADPQDLYALDRTKGFDGQYHVLHGLISPMDGINPEDLRIRELLQRLTSPQTAPTAQPALHLSPETQAIIDRGQTPKEQILSEEETIEEVILALPPSIEGDTTSLYISRLLKSIEGLTLTRIAFGLPVGGDLEYADTMTLIRALEGRQPL